MPTIIATKPALLLLSIILIFTFPAHASNIQSKPTALRIATFNIQDVRSEDLQTPDHPRLKEIARILQQIRPNIVLLSEIVYNDDESQSNANRFVELYLSIPQAPGLSPLVMNTYSPSSNTGIHTGIDLDNSGTIIDTPPTPLGQRNADSNTYANDCFGYGTFPGQYSMALLVHPKLTIEKDQIRSFQNFLWKDLPNATPPQNQDSTPWYSSESWEIFRLSSKNLVDVPITLPNGTTLHIIISHPTPPAFDGPEKRNKLRNHDEIRLIREYINNADYLYDDQGQTGGLPTDQPFCILGDLNADPTDGSSIEFVMISQLFSSSRVAKDIFPRSDILLDKLDPTDTSLFGLRVDYVLPSSDITINKSGVWRSTDKESRFPSDHFPVWLEILVP